MRVLVVGGAGYIGSHVCRELRARNYEVLIYDNLSTGYRFLVGDNELIVGETSDGPKIHAALRRSDVVMHFAASAYVGESVQNPRKYFENNVSSALVLLNAAVDAKIKGFVFSSTCAIYGAPASLPITEAAAKAPINPYGVSKLFFENALQAYRTAYGLPYACLRYFNAAGADESGEIGELHSPETHMIPLALAAVAGELPSFQLYGDDYPTPDGTCIRDYIHVNDLAAAHVAAVEYLMRGNPSLQVNLGTGKGHSIREVLTAIRQVTGRDVPTTVAPRRAGDPPELVADPRLANELLGWRTTRSLPEIISTAWNWKQRGGRG